MILINMINAASAPSALVRQVEAAIVRQVDKQVDRYWLAGPVRFSKSGTWTLTLTNTISFTTRIARATFSKTYGYLGYHGVNGSEIPYALVKYIPNHIRLWETNTSHEVVEMLVDPHPGMGFGPWPEICDDVQSTSYPVGNATVSNFLLPTNFTGAPGRRDWLGVLKPNK